jgi:hypothetical protein
MLSAFFNNARGFNSFRSHQDAANLSPRRILKLGGAQMGYRKVPVLGCAAD